jgi:hypothetical protein
MAMGELPPQMMLTMQSMRLKERVVTEKFLAAISV